MLLCTGERPPPLSTLGRHRNAFGNGLRTRQLRDCSKRANHGFASSLDAAGLNSICNSSGAFAAS